MTDRYLKVILTVIALELLWLGVKDIGTPVAAQAQAASSNRAATPVVITGVEMRGRVMDALPIYEMEPLAVMTTRPVVIDATRPVVIEATRPLQIEATRPLPIRGSVPLKIEVDRPLPVENVGYRPSNRPGE